MKRKGCMKQKRRITRSRIGLGKEARKRLPVRCLEQRSVAGGGLNRFLLLLGVLVLSTSHTLLYAGQPLETETSRLLKARQFEVENTFERQLSSEGTETSVPMAVEYGITDNLELLAEPVFYTAIRPKVGSQATGLGDVEVTLSYLFLHERSMFPALTTAAEVKIPTANDILISTKKTDYTGYLIASKRFGKFDTHANIGYTIIGKPAGVQLSNIFSFALAEEYHLNERFDIVGEILGNTSSSPEGSENAVAPEAAGGELVGMLGVRYRIQPHLLLALGVSYDNNNAVLIRPGLTFGFK